MISRHGFHYPNSLPARQSFIYIFLVLYLCCRGLDYEEVGYALDYLASCHSQCSSPAAYAIAVLYNAPDEAASYWDRKVANDLYSDRRQWSVA